MKRRSFIGTSAAGAIGLAAPGSGNAAPRGQAPAAVTTLAGKSLRELREEYRYWLFDDFVPFMDKFVIDHAGRVHVHGRPRRHPASPTSAAGTKAVALDLLALYGKLAKEQKYLDVADKSVKFIMKHKPEGQPLA